MADEYVKKCVRLRSHTTGGWFVHPDLRPKLVADADSQESNVNEVVVQILARAYKVPVVPSARRADATDDADQLQLRLPAELGRVLGATANARGRSGWTVQDEIRHALCAHYGLGVPAVVKRPRRRSAPRPAAAA